MRNAPKKAAKKTARKRAASRSTKKAVVRKPARTRKPAAARKLRERTAFDERLTAVEKKLELKFTADDFQERLLALETTITTKLGDLITRVGRLEVRVWEKAGDETDGAAAIEGSADAVNAAS